MFDVIFDVARRLRLAEFLLFRLICIASQTEKEKNASPPSRRNRKEVPESHNKKYRFPRYSNKVIS